VLTVVEQVTNPDMEIALSEVRPSIRKPKIGEVIDWEITPATSAGFGPDRPKPGHPATVAAGGESRISEDYRNKLNQLISGWSVGWKRAMSYIDFRTGRGYPALQ